jgi:hypothetical protein
MTDGGSASVSATTELVERVEATTRPELVTHGLEHGGVEHVRHLRGQARQRHRSTV